MADRAPCPCQPLSPGLYAIADACPEHGDPVRNARFLFCVCTLDGIHCLVCEQNELRGLGRSGLGNRATPIAGAPKSEAA